MYYIKNQPVEIIEMPDTLKRLAERVYSRERQDKNEDDQLKAFCDKAESLNLKTVRGWAITKQDGESDYIFSQDEFYCYRPLMA